MNPKPHILFSDLEKAFRHLSDSDLKRAHRVMKMVGSPFLNRIGPPLLKFAFSIGFPIKGFVRRTVFDIFCGGETLEETREKADLLYKAGVKTILDYSVEGEKTEDGFDATRDEIIRTLKFGAQNEAVAFSAMKATGIASFDLMAKAQSKVQLTPGESHDLLKGFMRVKAICEAAAEAQQPIFIDAEETWIQDTIDEWALDMMRTFNKEKPLVYTTLQLYRHDRLAYLKKLIALAEKEGFILGVKLVRGAYLEKENSRAKEMGYPTPMQPDKASTDRDFNAALEVCFNHIQSVAICAGTHNEESALLVTQLCAKKSVPANHPHVLCAQLLGMSDNISFILAAHGFHAAKYLPYGPVKAVLPYLIRRAQENTSVAGQAGRELAMLRKEMERRKLK